MTTLHGFDRLTAQKLVRTVYQLEHDVSKLRNEVVRNQSLFSAFSSSFMHVEYVKCIETLAPGGSAKSILQVWDTATEAYVDSKRFPRQANNNGEATTDLLVYDPHGWAFAIGTDDYADTPHVLPVVQSPHSGRLEVCSPCNLIQRAKPDANVTAGNTGTFSVYADETDTTVDVTAEVKWGDNGEDVTSGKESWVRYNIEAAKWEYIGGDCE